MTSPITISPGFRVLQTSNKSACPVEMAVADVNGDGLPDVLTTQEDSDAVSVLFNQGQGAFAPSVAFPIGGNAIAIFFLAVAVAEMVLAGRVLQAKRVRRLDLRAGHRLDGPTVVQEYSGTTWVPPGWTLEVDPWGCLHLSGGR